LTLTKVGTYYVTVGNHVYKLIGKNKPSQNTNVNKKPDNTGLLLVVAAVIIIGAGFVYWFLNLQKK